MKVGYDLQVIHQHDVAIPIELFQEPYSCLRMLMFCRIGAMRETKPRIPTEKA